MKRPSVRGLSAIALLTLCSGCVSFDASPLAPDWTASSQIQQKQISGLSVAVRTLDQFDGESEYIGRPAKECGFYPLVLLFENHSDSAFVLRKSGIRLETADGQVFPVADLPAIYDGLRYSKGSALWGLPFGIFPAFMMGSQISDQNEKMLEDLRSKTFHDLRLFRNPKTYNSLVFFNVGELALQLRSADCWMNVEVEREATPEQAGEVILFRLAPEGISD